MNIKPVPNRDLIIAYIIVLIIMTSCIGGAILK